MSGSGRPGEPRWYLRSLGDHDTHRGELREDGTVLARCGVEFTPKPTGAVVGRPGDLQLVTGPPALRNPPSDPDQICRKCQRKGGR